MRLNTKIFTMLGIAGAVALAAASEAQHAGHGAPSTSAPTAANPPAPVSMEELHRHGGVPRGWKFTLPVGDPKAGREAFSKFECNKCHEVKPDFPRGERGAGDVGPELTAMGGHHPAEYFAQSIVDPNAVIVGGPGFVGPDGRSIMPDYRDSLTFTELVDLVAYLKSLGGGAQGRQHHGATPVREQTAQPYRVRVEYHTPGRHAHQSVGAAPAAGHLMAFVTDADTGEAVPYLSVSVVITGRNIPPRTVRLAPMVSDEGFHYGADVTVPPDTKKVTMNVGPAVVKTTGAAGGRFQRRVTVSFDWSE